MQFDCSWQVMQNCLLHGLPMFRLVTAVVSFVYGIFFRIVNIAVVSSLCTIFFVRFYFVIGKLIDYLVNSKLNNVALELEQQTGEPIEPITIYPVYGVVYLGLLLYILCLLFRDEIKITSFLLLFCHN